MINKRKSNLPKLKLTQKSPLLLEKQGAFLFFAED
jgi:hypothetical protein